MNNSVNNFRTDFQENDVSILLTSNRNFRILLLMVSTPKFHPVLVVKFYVTYLRITQAYSAKLQSVRRRACYHQHQACADEPAKIRFNKTVTTARNDNAFVNDGSYFS